VLAQSVVRAPAAGTVYHLDAGRTEFVEEGSCCFSWPTLHHERVRAYFDEAGDRTPGRWQRFRSRGTPSKVYLNGHIELTPITVIIGTRSVGEVWSRSTMWTTTAADTNVTVKQPSPASPTLRSRARRCTLKTARPTSSRCKGALQRTYVTIGPSI